ncbi:hypothetical protein BC332_03257 [Capsicum chinense]|nr:hypothetical protein BC332_03257 [Capsicum chinense]
MDKEIGGDCDESLIAYDSGNSWNALDSDNKDKEISSLLPQMQLDIDSLGLSLCPDKDIVLVVNVIDSDKRLYLTSGFDHRFLSWSWKESYMSEIEFGECERFILKTPLCSLKFKTVNASERLEDLLAIIEGYHINFRDVLIQSIMMDKLYDWLVSISHEEDKGLNILDVKGKGLFI